MLGIDYRAARFTWTAAVVLLLLGLIYLIRETLLIFTVALLFAYLLYPLVDALNQFLPSRSRTPALAIVYLFLVAALVLLGITVGTQVAEQATSLAQRAPDLVNRMQQQPTNAPPAVRTIKETVLNAIQSQLRQRYQELISYVPRVSLEILSASRYLLFIVIIPILAFFILKDGRRIRNDLLALMEEGRRQDLVAEIMTDIHHLLLQYMRALMYLCGATFISFSLVLTAMGVPYAILLASIAFPLEFIPLVGPLAAAVIIVTVTIFAGYPHLLWVIIFLGAYRLFQDYVLSPHLMSAGVELHPLLVIFGVFAGGQIGGVAGTFLSIPVLALVRIVYHRVRKRRVVSPVNVLAG